MGKPIFFIFGLIAGLALAAVLYLQASGLYTKAVKNKDRNSAQNLEQAQTLWPPYMIDSGFQEERKKLRGESVEGSKVLIYLSEDASPEDTESLINQFEIMNGVEEVQWNTLEKPLEYINNMTTLPDSEEDIRDHIVVITSSTNLDDVVEFAKLQEIVENTTTTN